MVKNRSDTKCKNHHVYGWWTLYGGLCSQNILFRSRSLVVYTRMLAVFEALNISNEETSSLSVFALLKTAFSTAPNTDGHFINITEEWWHWGLFNTSSWGGDRPWATNIAWMCFTSQIIWSKIISSATTNQTHSEWQSPKRMPFSRLKLYYSGVNGILVSVIL